MAKIIWNVQILNKKTSKWKTIAELEFNYYSRTACMDYITFERQDIYEKINDGESWDVTIKSWE